MQSFVVTFLFSGAVYLWLTAGSGPWMGFWSGQELFAALGVAGVVGFFARKIFIQNRRWAGVCPLRWLRAVGYFCGPFFVEMAKANWDVAGRVLTGRIRPGIVRVKTEMKTDMGTLLMANSITLTPGTLTVDVDEESHDLFVHLIQVPEGMEERESIEVRELFSKYDCPSWVRRIAE